MAKIIQMFCLVMSVPTAFAAGDVSARLKLTKGFSITRIAEVDRPRELAAAPNGDLLVGTSQDRVMIVRGAEGDAPAVETFARIADAPTAGVAVAPGALLVGGQFGVWKIDYESGDRTARGKPLQIAKLRTSGKSRDHVTTSVAVQGQKFYASVGSSCDACDPELDATRATVQEMKLDGSEMHPRAIHIRNAVALAANPDTGQVWAIPNGQDALETGHPFEIGDAILTHVGVADYGWPHCYENRRKVEPSADCSHVVVPLLALPAYNAPIGAVIYPKAQKGKYPFPAEFRGGMFVALHGSWHAPLVPPRVVFVALEGDKPKTPVNWKDPSVQWSEFLSGFQSASGARLGRPTGVAVGAEGSLFVADDLANAIYRIRPSAR